MLIPSPRHTPADLEFWQELESADVIHGKRKSVRNKMYRAIESTLAFIADGQCYASVSWGKDSVVLAYLIAISAPHIPLVHLRVVPTENPHTAAVRDAFLSRFPDCKYHEITKESKHLYDSPEERMKAKKGSFQRPFDEAGYRGWKYLSGVRASESGARRIRMGVHGEATENTCAPIGWMSTPDVFGLLAALNLPVHPSYAMTGGGRWPRDRIRVSELAGEFGREYGRLEWEREYYGDELRRLGI